MFRIGFGYDIHPLADNRRLIIGGEEIPFSKGLLGHSDADVLLHALCDALLGALGEGDIGRHFPNTSPEFKDISSLILLDRVNALIKKKNYRINNLDLMILAEAPKLSGFFPTMINNLSRRLEIEPGQINIKATTNEGIGAIGKGEGIAAYAVALLNISPPYEGGDTGEVNKNDK
jgi:2-C-methyl-D-erythritol 2,4-cyclodiphosphate synthase